MFLVHAGHIGNHDAGHGAGDKYPSIASETGYRHVTHEQIGASHWQIRLSSESREK